MITESNIESAALDWLKELGYTVLEGPTIAPGELFQERTNYSETIITKRLKEALFRLNSGMPQSALEDAFRKLPSLSADGIAKLQR